MTPIQLSFTFTMSFLIGKCRDVVAEYKVIGFLHYRVRLAVVIIQSENNLNPSMWKSG
jgi:hypothetical protein